MKRSVGTRVAALALCLLMLATSALAAAQSGSLTGRYEGIGVYVDGEGGLFLTGYDGTMTQRYARQILCVNEQKVIYLAGEEIEDLGGEIVRLELSDFRETVLADGVYAACAAQTGQIYYVPVLDRVQLMKLDAETATAELVATTTSAISGLEAQPDGILVDTQEGSGALFYDADSGAFTFSSDTLARQTAYAGECYLRLSDEGLLTAEFIQDQRVEFVDFGVVSFAQLDGKIYYLTSSSLAQRRLKAFDPQNMSWQMLALYDEGVVQVAASAHSLFLLEGERGQVFVYDPETQTQTPFAFCGEEALRMDGYVLKEMRLEALSGQVNLYATFEAEDLEAEAEVPAFTFGDEPAQQEQTLSVERLVASWAVEGEQNTADVLQPQSYGTLSRGSRGEEVRALQQRLIELGYLDDVADGIFGAKTQYAVRLLQTDLAERGFSANGVATPELQDVLFNENLAAYDPYKPLSRGNSNLRVTILQERLRELGFLADAADGIYGERTQEAVALFETENGLLSDGAADSQMLRKLYASDARACQGYIYMEKGDTGYRVRQLNERLKELYYFEGTPGSTYNNATVAAVRRFQAEVGLTQSGVATASMQSQLYSPSAPEYSGYITLQRGDANSRVASLQTRLRELNYYHANVTGNYGSVTKAAVELFQYTAGLEVTGVATVETQQYLFSRYAPIYVEPTPTPSAQPTPTPTPTSGQVGEPKIGISPIDSVSGGVYYLDRAAGKVYFTWSADGDVEGYYVRISDSTGNTLLSRQVENTSGNLSTASLTQGVLYTLSVGAIPENGTVDNARWSHLQFALKGTPTATPTATPTTTPTATPTPALGEVSIPQVDIAPVKSVGVDMVNYVEEGTLTLSWSAEGDVEYYHVEIFDGMWTTLVERDFTAQSTTLGTRDMRQGEVYVLRVTAVPTNGSLEDGKYAQLRFALEPESPTAEPEVGTVTNVQAKVSPVSYEEDGVQYVNGDFELSWSAEGDVSAYRVIVSDGSRDIIDTTTTERAGQFGYSTLAEGVVYELRVTAIPVNGTEADGATATVRFAAEAQPEVGTVTNVQAKVSPVSYEEDGVQYVNGDFELSWSAEGDVSAYRVIVSDGSRDIIDTTTTERAGQFGYSTLAEGVVYELRVTAIPVNGTEADGATATVRFAAEPQPEVESELPAQESGSDGESPAQAAIWDAPMDRNSDPAWIMQLQDVLVQWGWLQLEGEGAATYGQLDERTIQAVLELQTYVNEQYAQGGAPLELIDPSAQTPSIGTDTLKMLFNDQGVTISKPQG